MTTATFLVVLGALGDALWRLSITIMLYILIVRSYK